MRTILNIEARDDWSLEILFADAERRIFDLKPLLECEAFAELKDLSMFLAVRNAGYFVEWPNGADLSADTLCLEGRVA